MDTFHGTTILCVRRDGKVALAGDGQVTMDKTVMKSTARKVRRLAEGTVLAGFAGATADAFQLFELFEKKIKEHARSLPRAAVELAKQWRTDRMLRRLEALLVVADKENRAGGIDGGGTDARRLAQHRVGRFRVGQIVVQQDPHRRARPGAAARDDHVGLVAKLTVRVNRHLEAGADDALGRTVSAIQKIQTQYGRDAFAVLGGASMTNEKEA